MISMVYGKKDQCSKKMKKNKWVFDNFFELADVKGPIIYMGQSLWVHWDPTEFEIELLNLDTNYLNPGITAFVL